MKFMKILCPCGYKTSFNADKVVPCPNEIFERYATTLKAKDFIDEPVTEYLHCDHRGYGGPTSVDISHFTRKEYIKLTDVYWHCAAKNEDKKVVLI